MEKIISLLLGSGFSKPAGLPTVNDINKRMAQINEDEILIHSSMVAMFFKDQSDGNPKGRWEERLFVQKFLEFYNSQILLSGEQFHYEKFYDFYSLYLADGKGNKDIFDKFCNEFTEEYIGGQSTFDTYNRIAYFNRTFNQLLAFLLHRIKYLGEVTYFSSNNYQGFTDFLNEILKTHFVKVHTLNHDLFFEWLVNYASGLYDQFCDGFEFDGSPFYGILRNKKYIEGFELHKSYRVKLAHFTGRFENKLSLFKLHGSINNYIVHSDSNKTSRVHWEYGIDELYKEKKDSKSRKMTTVGAHENVDPDFLTGVNNKVRQYKNDAFYKTLFTHFKKNLKSSDLLLVIGYGFADPGINDYIEKHFLSLGKKMVVIDPVMPNSPFFKKYDITYISSGITELTSNKFLNLLS